MKERVGLGKSFDLGVRKIIVLKKEIHIYYVNGLCDTMFIIQIMKSLIGLSESGRLTTKVYDVDEKSYC